MRVLPRSIWHRTLDSTLEVSNWQTRIQDKRFGLYLGGLFRFVTTSSSPVEWVGMGLGGMSVGVRGRVRCVNNKILRICVQCNHV